MKTPIKHICFIDHEGVLLSRLDATPDLLILIGLMEAGCTHEIRHEGDTLTIYETEE